MYRIPLANEQITKALTTPFAPVDFTDEEKEQILENIGAGSGSGGGRNLLDNGWFTVNQRGANSALATAGAYISDRWAREGGSFQVQHLSPYGIKVNVISSMQFTQKLEVERFVVGKTYTLSAIIDGELVQTSGVYNGIQPTAWYVHLTLSRNNIRIRLRQINAETEVVGVVVDASGAQGEHTILCVKLEICESSTLANDAPPNYAIELIKCQRYFIRFAPYNSAFMQLGLGLAKTATICDTIVVFPVELRAAPAISYKTRSTIALAIGTTQIYPSNINIDQANPKICNVRFTASGLTVGSAYQVLIYNDATNYIDFSADL